MIRPEITVDQLNQMNAGNMGEHLGITFTALGPDFIEGQLPVDHRTRQPMGLLHGGVSVVLAETLGSVGAWCTINPETHYCVGLDINANHIRGVKQGFVSGKATPLHLGKTTQVWEIRITDEQGKLVCISRLTIAVLERKP